MWASPLEHCIGDAGIAVASDNERGTSRDAYASNHLRHRRLLLQPVYSFGIRELIRSRGSATIALRDQQRLFFLRIGFLIHPSNQVRDDRLSARRDFEPTDIMSRETQTLK